MNDLGNFVLVLGWGLALFAMCAGIFGAYSRREGLRRSVTNATIGVGVCSFLAIFSLALLFVSNDYSNQYVWQFSNRSMPTIYKVSAIWGGMDGSMLLWCVMLSLSGAIVALRVFEMPQRLVLPVLGFVNAASTFFLTVVVFYTNPFRYLRSTTMLPADGNGLNPLLQNPFMAIHPPMLYAGFTTFAVPAAFCLGALLAGDLSNTWIRLTRRWTLIAWGFLTTGIVLGGFWAYIELGWGGFWAWDPVENASFFPWLTGTAFLHSVMVQERKNMLRFWNVWLVVTTYGLTVFGTFLTRSGVVQSVHAFASTDIGWIFLTYLGLLFVVTCALTYLRRRELRSERRIESLFSREAAFLLNNLLLLSICFATIWGVMFPVLSEAITGSKMTVGVPFFNSVNVPLFLMLVFLMAIGPLLAWRRATWTSMRRTFVRPFFSAMAIGALLLWAGVREFYPLLSYQICVFVFLTLIGEIYRGYRAQRGAVTGESRALDDAQRLLRRHRVRYGGYLVHFGVAIVTIGITASMAHKVERDFSLAPKERFEIGRFALMLNDISEGNTDNYGYLSSVVDVYSRDSGELLATLRPEMRRYFRNDESTTEVAIRPTLREDLYLVLAGMDQDGTRAAFKVFINPLQMWLWIGAVIMVCGIGIILLPQRAGVTATDPAFGAARSGRS